MNEEQEDSLEDEYREKLGVALKTLLLWIIDNGKAKEDKAGQRAYVAAWYVLDSYQNLNQTDLALKLHKKNKQDLSRNMISFRETFAGMGNSKTRSDTARKVMSDKMKESHERRKQSDNSNQQ
jgi:hypothetical protein